MSVETGYFGVPGSSGGNFTVHVITAKGPLCGWRPRKEMKFQWCAHGIRWEYIECDSCMRAAKKLLFRNTE